MLRREGASVCSADLTNIDIDIDINEHVALCACTWDCIKHLERTRMARSKHIVFGSTHDNEELGQSENKDQFINVGKNFRN